MNDHRSDIYERACTVEGDTRLTQTLPINSKYLLYELERTAQMIVGTIESNFGGSLSIKYLNLVLKKGKDDRIWLLYSDSLGNRFRQTSESENKLISHTNPSFINPQRIKILSNDVDIRDQLKCVDCQEYGVLSDFYQIKYNKFLVNVDLSPKNYPIKLENTDNQSSKNPVFYYKEEDLNKRSIKKAKVRHQLIRIPDIFKKLYPNILEQQFKEMIKDHTFLNQTATLCSRCYMKWMRRTIEGGRVLKPQPQKKPKSSFLLKKRSKSYSSINKELFKTNQKNMKYFGQFRRESRHSSMSTAIQNSQNNTIEENNPETRHNLKTKSKMEKKLLNLIQKNQADINLESQDFKKKVDKKLLGRRTVSLPIF